MKNSLNKLVMLQLCYVNPKSTDFVSKQEGMSSYIHNHYTCYQITSRQRFASKNVIIVFFGGIVISWIRMSFVSFVNWKRYFVLIEIVRHVQSEKHLLITNYCL